jgi:Rrf2 family nitric oxide-sensitive transcriptional repressor
VVRATETDFRLVECFDATTNACTLSPACRLKHLFDDALAGYFKALDGATLADMTQGPTLPRSRTIAPPASRRRALGTGQTEARRVARPRGGA